MTPVRRPGIFSIFARELRLLFKHPYVLVMICGGPLVYPLLYNTVYIKKMERDVPVAMVDCDCSESSRQFTRDCDANEFIAVTEVYRDVAKARERLNAMAVMAIIVIPEGFEADMKRGKQARIEVALSNLRFLVASDINRGLGDVLAGRGRVETVKAFERMGYGPEQAQRLSEPIRPFFSNLYNSTECYGDFIIVGLLVVIFQQTLLLGMAVSMALEREKGMLPQLFRLGRGSIGRIIAGKGGFYCILYCCHALLYFTLFYRVYHIPFTGSPLALGLSTVMHVVSIVVWAMFLSSFFKEKIFAMTAFLFSSYPLFLISGYSWPTQALPTGLQCLSKMSVMTPFLHANAVITQMSGAVSDITPDLLRMGAIFAAGLALLWLRLAILRGQASTSP